MYDLRVLFGTLVALVQLQLLRMAPSGPPKAVNGRQKAHNFVTATPSVNSGDVLEQYDAAACERTAVIALRGRPGGLVQPQRAFGPL